jgi:heptaprenyl diphosphate synthase
MTKKISILALFTAFAIVLSYIESFLPVMGIPGVKLGLANLAVVLTMYLLGLKEAFLLNVIRIILIGAMFGNLSGILFSIAGATVSFFVMAVLKITNKFSVISVGVVGGVFHNIGQIVVAAWVVDTFNIIVYIPVLIFSGIITGTLIGLLAQMIYTRTKKNFDELLR